KDTDVAGCHDFFGRLNGIGDDEFLEPRRRDTLDRATGEHAVADIGIYRLRFVLEQRVGGVYQRTTGVDDVIHQHAGVTGHITDHIHDFRVARAFAPFVDNGERSIDTLRKSARAHDAANVRRYHHDIVEFKSFTNVTDHNRRCVKIVGRDV